MPVEILTWPSQQLCKLYAIKVPVLHMRKIRLAGNLLVCRDHVAIKSDNLILEPEILTFPEVILLLKKIIVEYG